MRSNLPWFHIIGALFCEMPSPWFCEMDTLFCKLRQADFARDERSNLDFKNCSDIGAVTWLIICLLIFTFQTFVFFTPPYLIGSFWFGLVWEARFGKFGLLYLVWQVSFGRLVFTYLHF